MAESRQGRRPGTTERPEAGAALRRAVGGRGSAPGRRTEPRVQRPLRLALDWLSHRPSASIFSVAGAFSCLASFLVCITVNGQLLVFLPLVSFLAGIPYIFTVIFSLNPVVRQSPLASHRDGCVTWPCRSFLVWFQLPALSLPVLWGGHSPSLCLCTRLSSCRAPIRLPAPRGQPLCDAFSAVLGLTPSASNVNSAKRHSNTGTHRVDLCFTSPRCEPVSPFSGPGLCLIYLCVPSTRPYVESAPWMFAEWT